MAWTPGRLTCDLCEQPITGRAHPMFLMPLTPDQLSVIAETMSEQVKATLPSEFKVFGDIQPIMLPTHYRFTFCAGCVDGFMPMLDVLRQKAVDGIVQRVRRRIEKIEKKALDNDDRIKIHDDDD